MKSSRTMALVLAAALAACGRSSGSEAATPSESAEVLHPTPAADVSPIDSGGEASLGARASALPIESPVEEGEVRVCGGSQLESAEEDDSSVSTIFAPITAAERARLRQMRDDAKSFAAGPVPNIPRALQAYSDVEDEATRLLDAACAQSDEDSKGYCVQQFKEILNESNEFVESVFTPECVEKQPWTDLLAASQSKHWQNHGVQDFRLEGGALHVVGPASGAASFGLIAVPEAGGYRDFELEAEFTFDGAVEFLFRLGRRVDNTVEYYALSTKNENEPLRPGRSYTLRVRYVGDHLSGSVTPEDATFADVQSAWTKSRRGAVGVQLHERAELTLRRLRIRVLRGYVQGSAAVRRESRDPTENSLRISTECIR